MSSLLTNGFWIAAASAKVGLLVLLVRNRQAQEHPFFALYLAIGLARNLVLMAIAFWGTQEAYFYAYRYTLLLESVAMLLVAIEVMRSLFAPHDLLPRQLVYRALWAVGATAFLAVAIVLFSSPGHLALLNALDRLQRGVSLMAAALFWLLYYHSELLGLSPRYLGYSVTTGFVFYCTMNYLVAIGSAAGLPLPGWSGGVSFLVASGIWFSSVRGSLRARSLQGEAKAVGIEA